MKVKINDEGFKNIILWNSYPFNVVSWDSIRDKMETESPNFESQEVGLAGICDY